MCREYYNLTDTDYPQAGKAAGMKGDRKMANTNWKNEIHNFSFTDEESQVSYFVAVDDGRITVETDSHIGHNVVFNEAIERFSSLADLTNELHDQNLEDIENAIWDAFGEQA